MSENDISYWDNWLEREIDIPITRDGYIFNYKIINMNSSGYLTDWVCCTSKDKLYSFIKYFILPSVQLTRTLGKQENITCCIVLDYDETLCYLDDSSIEDYQDQMNTFTRWFDDIDEMEKRDVPLKELRDYLNDICLEIDLSEGVFVDLDVFENISSLGKTLVEDYENDNVLGILELELEMNKEQILDLFENIDENPFMMKRITEFLINRLG